MVIERKIAAVARPIYRSRCQHCSWCSADLDTGAVAEQSARDHSERNRHDVEIRFDLLNQVLEVIRVADPRDE